MSGAAHPLFPLDLVALPGELIPLHVFEERYRVMFARLRAEGGSFGIVWAADDGLRDGRLPVHDRPRPRGARRRPARRPDLWRDARCGSTGELSHDPYPAAPVDLLEDEEEDDDPAARGAAEQAYDALVAAVTGQPADPGALAGMGAYAMAGTIELGLDVKQELLELRSERARLHLLERVLSEILDQLGPGELAQARARSNGTIRF